MTVWRMRIPCWIPTATNTQSQYVTRMAVPKQQLLHERVSLLGHAYTVSPVYPEDGAQQIK